MDAKLLVVAGGPKDQVVQLQLPAVIGRSREADVTIPHPLVSRRHCEIVAGDDGQLRVHDLGSLNGTFVGKNRVDEALLKPGDLLTIGAITFRAAYGPGGAAEEASLTPLEEQPDFDLSEGSMDETLDVAETELMPLDEETPKAGGASDEDADFDLDWLSEEDV